MPSNKKTKSPFFHYLTFINKHSNATKLKSPINPIGKKSLLTMKNYFSPLNCLMTL